MTPPFRHLHRNIMLGHGDQHAAVYRLDTVSYPYLPEREQEATRDRLADFIYGIGVSFSLYRVCRAYPANNYVAQGKTLLDGRFADPARWRAFLTGHQERIAGLASFIPEVYLAVELRNRRPAGESVRARAGDALARARQHTLLLDRALRTLDEAEEHTLGTLGTQLPVRRATTREIQWLLRRAPSRGHAEPLIDENWEPAALTVHADDQLAYRPWYADLAALTNPPIKRTLTGLLVDSDEGESHQAFLTLGRLPKTTVHPGNAELLYKPLERVGFPVDVAIHVRRIAGDEARKRVRKKARHADNEVREADSVGIDAISDEPVEASALARKLHAYLSDPSSPPLLDVSISFALGAATRKQLEERVHSLRQAYGTVTLHRPLGSQRALYADHLPRPDRGAFRDYAKPMTREQLASLIPHGIHHTGAHTGVYFARTVTGSNRPVKQDVTEATRRKRSPSILLTGGLGAGKTVTLETICLHAALRGSLVVDIDPKNDHRLEALPELAGKVTILELDGSERFAGMLDPLTIGSQTNREDLALSYYLDLLPHAPMAWETHLTNAIRHALGREDPCGQRVIDWLAAQAGESERECGEALAVRADTGLGRLAFSDGTQERMLARSLVTTIRPGILDLPEAGAAPATRSERMSVATFTLLTNFAMGLLGTDRSRHRVLSIDEAWFLLGPASGRRFISRVNFFGRTNFITLLLAAQQLGAVGDIEDLIGTRIVHGQETEAQARLNLQMLGLDPEDENLRRRLMNFRMGRALMKDLDGRVAEIQIDPVYPHILELLDVNREAPVPAVNAAANGKPHVTLGDIQTAAQ